MDVVGKKVESQVQFWSFLGPFFILLSITVLLLKVSAHWYFPVSALIGIPLCVKWKMKGMAMSLCCLFLLSGIGYQSLELDDRYWHVGLALTMAFSFIVLTLSLEEVQGVVSKIELESQSRLDNFLLLDEKLKQAEQEWALAKEKSKSEVTALTQELAKIQEDKQTFYKLAQLAKDELVQLRNQHDQLVQDLLYKKQQITQLQEHLEETEMTVQDFVNSDAEKQIQTLRDSLANVERDKQTLMAKIALGQTEGLACQEDKRQLQREIETYREREKLSLIEKQHWQEEKLKLQSFQTKCDLFEQEKNMMLQAQTKLMQQYEQVRYVEAQQQQMIQQSQSKIFDLEVKLNVERQQKTNLQISKQELEDQLVGRDQTQEQQQKEQIVLKQANQEVQERYQTALEDLDRLREELGLRQQALVQVERQVEELRNKLKEQEVIRQSEQLPYASGNHRQIEAMYLQLKGQFQEKSTILDKTRRELFHANEALLAWEKEYEEEHIFGQTKNEKSWQDHYVKLGRNYDKIKQLYQQEIDELTQLVEHLLLELALH